MTKQNKLFVPVCIAVVMIMCVVAIGVSGYRAEAAERDTEQQESTVAEETESGFLSEKEDQESQVSENASLPQAASYRSRNQDVSENMNKNKRNINMEAVMRNINKLFVEDNK